MDAASDWLSRLGPVIIIVLGCDDGRLPEPDEALLVLPVLPLELPGFEERRLFMLKGTGEGDWDTLNFCFSSSVFWSAAAVVVVVVVDSCLLVSLFSLVLLLVRFIFGFLAFLEGDSALFAFEIVSFESSELFDSSCCDCSSLLLALVSVLDNLSSSELSSFEWLLLLLASFFELVAFGIDVGDESEKLLLLLLLKFPLLIIGFLFVLLVVVLLLVVVEDEVELN